MDNFTRIGFYTVISLLVLILTYVTVIGTGGIPEDAYSSGAVYRGSTKLSDIEGDGVAEMLGLRFTEAGIVSMLFNMDVKEDAFAIVGNTIETKDNAYTYNRFNKTLSVKVNGETLVYERK